MSAMHSFISLAITIAPLFSMLADAMASLFNVFSSFLICSKTLFAKRSLGVIKKLLASSSCSAWLSRSIAIWRAFALSSAMTPISLGPAIISIFTSP